MVEKVFKKHYKDVDAFFTDRWEGVSSPPYHELNLALHVGDNPVDVLKNRELLAKRNNFYIDNLIYMDQIHSNNIQIITNSLINKIPNCDAIITKEPNIPLMVMVADCIPILIYDPKNKVIAAVHAGRNGTFLKIAPKTITTMQENFNSNPNELLVSFGPSIHSCCYEVQKDLADITEKNFGKKYVIKRDDKYFLDIQTLNIDQLNEVGVLKENIFHIKTCTACDENYFSYRREKVTGRFAGVIKLNG